MEEKIKEGYVLFNKTESINAGLNKRVDDVGIDFSRSFDLHGSLYS